MLRYMSETVVHFQSQKLPFVLIFSSNCKLVVAALDNRLRMFTVNPPVKMSSVPHLDVAFSWNGGVAGHAFFPVVKAVRPEWQTELVKYRYFTEGISNKLIGAHTGATMDDDPDAILIRIHGNDTDLLIDREREKQTFKLLFDHKCSTARLLATFNNGCSYSYIAGRPLDVEDVRQPDICKLIISRMVQMHGIHQSDDASSCVPALFSTLDKWMEIVSSDMRTQRTERWTLHLAQRICRRPCIL